MRASATIAIAAALALLPAVAGQFTVTPMRADLNAESKSAAFTVINGGQETLAMQVGVRRWTQDAAGRDRFEDSSDLVFYPKRFDVPPGARRVVRVGTNSPGSDDERGYRVYLEELPSPASAGAPPDSQIAVLVQFAVPVFVGPARPLVQAQVESFDVAGGRAMLRLRNAGNRTFVVAGLDFTPAGAAVKDFSEWYLMPGAVREYSATLEPAACASGKLEVDVRLVGGPTIRAEVGVGPAQCGG